MLEKFALVLVRGLSGSGKTTFAGLLGDPIAADDYFYDEAGKYNFDPKLLPKAHQMCQETCATRMAEKEPQVVVANTFSTRWELEPYLIMAQRFGYKVFVVDLFDGGCTDEQLTERNSHGVPLETITNMRSRWEHTWRNGNPLPPWERG